MHADAMVGAERLIESGCGVIDRRVKAIPKMSAARLQNRESDLPVITLWPASCFHRSTPLLNGVKVANRE